MKGGVYMRKCIKVLALCLSLLISSIAYPLQSDASLLDDRVIVTPYYTNIFNFTNLFKINPETGIATVYSSIVTYDCDKSAVNVTVQRYDTATSSWVSVMNWSRSSPYGYAICAEEFPCEKGVNYRMTSMGSAYTGGYLVEREYYTSQIEFYY